MHLLAFAETIQLFPDGTIFIHIAIILVMIWLLNRTLYRPINRIIESRERSKGGYAGEAAEILSDVAEKEARYNRELLEARSAGYSLIEEEQRKAGELREQKLGSVKAEIAEHLEKGRAELERETAAARESIRANAEQMADNITRSILKG